MKFLICLTIIAFGVCGVISAAVETPTASAATNETSAAKPAENTQTNNASTTAAATSTNPITNLIDSIDQIAKNFGDAILNATKGLGNAASSASQNASNSGIGSIFLNPLISSINTVVQNIINGVSKTAFSAIDKLLNTTAEQLSETSTKISSLQACASKNGQSPVNITEPLDSLMQCPVNAFAQAGKPVGKTVQVVTQVASSITSDVGGAMKCFATPIFGFLPNFACFAGIGVQSFLRGISDTSDVFSLGSSIGNDIMTIVPDTMDCFNQKWNGIIKTFTESGVNVAQCLQ